MIWIIVGSVLLFLICLILILAYVLYKRAFYSPIKGQNNEFNLAQGLDYQGVANKANECVAVMLKIPYEDLETKSKEGFKLHGYFYKSEGSNEYVIMFHGYRRTARRSFSGLTMDLLKEHKNVILADFRGHGQSEGHKITLGKKEQYDVLSWINFAKKHFGEDIKITIVGVSMGATTVLMAADKIDPRVKIIADSPNISSKKTIKLIIRKLKYPTFIFYPLTMLSALLFCHTHLSYDVRNEITKSNNNILIIFGGKDKSITSQEIESVELCNKEHVKIEVFEGIEHGLCYLKCTDEYRKLFFDFINS